MYNITLQQIETFLTVGKYLNMTRAAERLYTTQPTLSKTLQRFENAIGFQVFNRESQGVTFTPQGDYLYRTMQSLYNNINEAISNAEGIAKGSNKPLKVSMPSLFDVSEGFLKAKQLIKEFEAAHPEIYLEEYLYDFVELRKNFEMGNTEIVFSNEIDMSGIDNVSTMRICKYPIYLIASSEHELAKHKVWLPEMLSKEIVFQLTGRDNSLIKEEVTKTCHLMGFRPKKIVLVDNFQTYMHFILSKKGIGFCDRFVDPTSSLIFYPLDGIVGNTYCSVTWHPDTASDSAKLFLQFIENRIANEVI